MGAAGVGFSTGLLFTIGAGQIISFKLWDNLALRNSGSFSTWLRTSFTNDPDRNFPNNFTGAWFPPAAGFPWPNNDNIFAL